MDKEEPTNFQEAMEVFRNHMDLCNKLHERMDDIPKSVKDDIWDLVYSHFNPN